MAGDDVLIDVPMPILTPRLVLRPPRAGDGGVVHAAKRESWPELREWMIWSWKPLEELTVDDDEAYCRKKQASFILREDLTLLLFNRETGAFLGGSGLHDCNWKSRIFTIGFWIRSSETGRGYATEVATALARYAFEALAASKVSVFHAEGNSRSRRVIEKVGFEPEGVLRKQHPLPNNSLVDEHHYGLLSPEKLPPLDVEWGRPAE
jgi:RimJ/RimL family protein N-acetyltransferase